MKTNKRKKLTILLIALLILTLTYICIVFLPKQQSYGYDNPFITKNDRPLIFAHRGGADEFPENTLEAYYNATSICSDAVLETDVHLTKDGVLILLHDDTLDSTCDRTGNIKDINYSDLIKDKVNFGYDNDTENGNLVGDAAIIKEQPLLYYFVCCFNCF